MDLVFIQVPKTFIGLGAYIRTYIWFGLQEVIIGWVIPVGTDCQHCMHVWGLVSLRYSFLHDTPTYDWLSDSSGHWLPTLHACLRVSLFEVLFSTWHTYVWLAEWFQRALIASTACRSEGLLSTWHTSQPLLCPLCDLAWCSYYCRRQNSLCEILYSTPSCSLHT